MADRVILHCDMNNFYCSVELLEHPELAGKPVAVAGSEDDRHGIILAKNQIAKSVGIVTAETIWQARKKCPNLILLKPHHDKYYQFYKTINSIYLRYTDMVEPFSIDESWLDVTGSLKLFKKNGKELADEIRETVYKETKLTLSAGVSWNKVFAKMGSDYKKPYATTEITRDNYKDILWPLPAGDLFFVGKASAAKLREYGINTIGDIAGANEGLLSRVFGKHGHMMKDYANGLDEEHVARFTDEREVKSVGNGITFKRNLVGESDIKTAVTAISDRVATRLRKQGLRCCGVKVDIKDPNFVTITRQVQLEKSTDLAADISEAALEIIRRNWYMESPIRLLTITGINVIEGSAEESVQLSIFDTPEKEAKEEQNKALEETIDAIRGKLGRGAITKGSLIGNDLGIYIEER